MVSKIDIVLLIYTKKIICFTILMHILLQTYQGHKKVLKGHFQLSWIPKICVHQHIFIVLKSNETFFMFIMIFTTCKALLYPVCHLILTTTLKIGKGKYDYPHFISGKGQRFNVFFKVEQLRTSRTRSSTQVFWLPGQSPPTPPGLFKLCPKEASLWPPKRSFAEEQNRNDTAHSEFPEKKQKPCFFLFLFYVLRNWIHFYLNKNDGGKKKGKPPQLPYTHCLKMVRQRQCGDNGSSLFFSSTNN